MTFVPDKRGDKEFDTMEEAEKAASDLLNCLAPLSPCLVKNGIDLVFKAEPFRRDPVTQDFNRWIVEVTNGDCPPRASQWAQKPFIDLIQIVFDEAKKLKLLPRIRRRGIHYPTGGCHLHVGISDLFYDSVAFLPRLALFERNLYIDYANRPYVRWLFSEWFDLAVNSRVTVTEAELALNPSTEEAYRWGRDCSVGIQARYSYQATKRAYLSYEFRFFDMVDSAKELALNVEFLEAWVARHVKESGNEVKHKFALTKHDFRRFKNEKQAWETIVTFLADLGLRPENYRRHFEENYLLRLRHGHMP